MTPIFSSLDIFIRNQLFFNGLMLFAFGSGHQESIIFQWSDAVRLRLGSSGINYFSMV